MFRPALNPLETKNIFSAERSYFKKFTKIHQNEILRKNSHIPGRGELLHQYTKFEGNLIVFKKI